MVVGGEEAIANLQSRKEIVPGAHFNSFDYALLGPLYYASTGAAHRGWVDFKDSYYDLRGEPSIAVYLSGHMSGHRSRFGNVLQRQYELSEFFGAWWGRLPDRHLRCAFFLVRRELGALRAQADPDDDDELAVAQSRH